MARILRSETSLLRRQNAIARELGARVFTRFLVWGIAAGVCVWGGLHTYQHRTYGGLIGGALALVFAAGYEVRLREIAVERRNLEGGHRGEQRMAELLAEQLADDHVILNDLDFRVAHERCQIDHLVLAPSGLYILESKYWSGTLTGDVHDTQWTQKRADGRTKIVKSPVLQAERQRRMFITLLPASVPEDRIHALAVFTHPAAKLHIANGRDKAFLVRNAIRYINDRCFDPPVLTEAQILDLAEHINRRQA